MANRKILITRKLVAGSDKPTELESGNLQQSASDDSDAELDNSGFSAAGSVIESGPDSFDPGSIGDGTTGTDGTGSTRRKRGRPAGSRNGSTRTGTAKNTNGLESLFFSTHLMLANAISVSELALSEDEAKAMAKAIKEVSDLYDTPMVPPEIVAWGNLAIVLGGVYIPRAIAFNNNKKKGKGEIKAPAQQAVRQVAPGVIDISAVQVVN